ncbi:MAG: SulP family inorganic anion transporter, partial [Xanthobacteraceae bacterium]
MAVSGVGADSTFGNQKFRAALTDVFAGAICSILSIAYCLSYAALIFTGPLEHVLSYGVAVTFLSAAIGGSIVALRSSLPFAIAGPDSSVSVVMAAMVATLVHRLATHGGTEFLVPTLVAMSLTTALTGLLLCILGLARAGRAIRFVPFPVIGGFLGATGWLMILGAVQVAADQRPELANLSAFANVAIAAKLAAGLIVAIALHLALRRSKNPLILPGVLLAAFVATYVVLLSSGFSVAEAQAQGWMFGSQPAAGL